MEPLDPTKNVEGSGFSKRRISSILKAPRKSARFPDPEQQENVVECVKPAEKRNSRRVSFAPANDVLLFSKDVKNGSPARSPLQESVTATAAATQNRVQVAVTENGSQQIMGMESLLNAPLHTSQQKDKVNTGDDFGEKTVMYSTDDAFMDMTHSHTVIIASDAEALGDIPLQNYDILTAGGDKRGMFTVDDGSTDMTPSHTVNMTSGSVSLSTGRGISASLPCLDPGFEKFLASLSNPRGPSSNAAITRVTPPAGPSSEGTNSSLAQIKTPRNDVDKENQAPTSVSTVMEKSLNAIRRIGESSFRSVLCPEDDVSMDMTEAQTGRILGVSEDDPFQCLFPTQDMYGRSDRRVSQTTEMLKTKQQQSSKTSGSTDPKDKKSLIKPPLHAPRQKVSSDAKDDCREKTVMFAADEECMDMTQSHTVNIASGPLASEQMSTNSFDPEFKNFLASLSKQGDSSGNPIIASMIPTALPSSKEAINTNSSLSQLKTAGPDVGKENQPLNTNRSFGASLNRGAICPEGDVSMDMTEAQTGGITGLTGSDDAFQFLFPSQDMYPHCDSLKKASGQQSSGALGSSNHKGVETSLKPSLKTKVQRHQDKLDTEDDYREKTVRFSADDACMDVTQSHTVNIISNLQLQSHQNTDFLPANGEKTVRFSASDAAMDVTQSHTVNIATYFKPQADFLPTFGEKTVRFSANDAAMDMTQCLTTNIASYLVSDSVLAVKKQEGETCGLPGNRSSSTHSDNFLTTSSKTSDPSIIPVIASMTPARSSHGLTICPKDDISMDITEAHTGFVLGGDVSMDMTEAQTGCIIETPGTDDPLQCLLPKQGMYPQSGNRMEAEITSRQQSSEAVGPSNCKGMETSLKTQRHQVVCDADVDCREKTVRFTADEACMDVTRSHTVNIISNLQTQPHRNVDFVPADGEKTVRFTASDATMDVTRSHTVNIISNLQMQPHRNVDFLPANGEKTVRFTASDAAMDVTRSHTVNIISNLQPQPRQNVDFLPADGEKTARFTASDAAMDMTRSHTVDIATDFEPSSHQNVDVLPTSGEKTVRFTANDMDMTQCLTVNINSNSATDQNVLPIHEDVDFPFTAKRESETCGPRRSRSSSAHGFDRDFNNSPSATTDRWANPEAEATDAPSLQETTDTYGFLVQAKSQKPDRNTQNEDPSLVSAATEKSVNKTMTESPQINISMDMTEAQTGHILGQTCKDEPPLLSTQDLSFEDLKTMEVTLHQSSDTPGSSNPDDVELTNLPDSLDSNATETRTEPEPSTTTCSLSPKIQSSPSAVDQGVDTSRTRKSRRMSIADIQAKIRRLSHMVNTAPDAVALDSCTAPLPQLDHDLNKNSKDETISLPVVEPELEIGLVNTEGDTQAEQPSAATTNTTPFSSKTKQLMSRLSMSNFKPKLPQRSKLDDSKKARSAGEHTRTVTVNVANQLSNFDGDVSDIYDEELGSYEEMSETLDTRSPQKISRKGSPSQEFNLAGPLEDGVFEEDFIRTVHGQKTPLPEDKNKMEDEKTMKASAETVEMASQSDVVECDSNITTARMTTQTIDSSNNSHTASIRCEATFESTFKQSMLEDYGSDAQKNLEEGTITVSEFFKLFNIDFVIHNPRQSVLPGRLLSDTDVTPMDLLRDRHINRPKQIIYEKDVLTLTENVETLKVRMRDLDKPLKTFNRPLWEEMRYSSEEELRSFGAKLKERNNFFRKAGKALSHEMKEVLYSDLVQANLDEQQKLRGKIEEADEMIKSLDDCIREVETELAAVEEKGFEGKPSLISLQEGMKKVTETLADNERQISELELQKKQNSSKLKRLRAETKDLESHIAVLDTLNEWRFRERTDDCTVYTFLHETMQLQLVYEKSTGDDADSGSEQKIADIAFRFELDDEKSQFHARLVHKLVSQYIEREPAWVEKYPTHRHVPKLLHDVSLVVSHCRLLGEELRLLKMWGGLRLDILDISCVDNRVHLVFSSLKTLSKFEVVFTVSLTNYLYALQVESFKNIIGSTTIQHIEGIVASFTPARNLLTKTVKKIHDGLLC